VAAKDAFAVRLGHRFRDPALLDLALTHRSAQARAGLSNERLEFLGDRVLALAVAELLYRRFPGESEGALSRRLAALVRRESLAEIAVGLELGSALALSCGEEAAGGRANPGLLSDACEALIGAVYLDGGAAAAFVLVERLWSPLIDRQADPPKDSRTRLQEYVQSRGTALPVYETVGAEGPDHAPRFQVRVTIPDARPETGEGTSKQAASEAAARALLKRLDLDG
jgi:ribonuclease-3